MLQGPLILAEVLEEAKARAKNEFHVAEPEKMFVAEAFPIQCKILKGRKRHAHEMWTTTRYRYINLFVRLEEGNAPKHTGRQPALEGWDQMADYYKYLRNREIKYST